ncbi:aminotransferase class III-fold pyridoxal phosphate-dependent enzyme [Heliobacterium chlorum]|uniref:Aminotransferase class III-fold pyridoxal phosphate-dependent enzyme n=1 Tax=Heliobacterium chlorum TaxID=2698 RepID=A0ABR7T0E0_HELCL|nr:aminotransferase class III-fold pyridoxal phosphate-dependent enzyme [Heliobacterium chlorum]MBC9783146.1 aminotransferase class III-fold pyridoxal phosphate-dependent enzyme [Heliobacterium chlorum]
MKSVVELYEEHINPSVARLYRLMGMASTAIKAEGSYVVDDQGRTFLDFLGNFGTVSLGHRHRRVVDAVISQLGVMGQTSRYLLDEPTARLAQMLAQLTPGDLQYCFFCNSGTEAVEAAIKLARLATGKSGLVGTINGFHGKTLGALSVSGREPFREPFEPLLPRVKHIPYGEVTALVHILEEDRDVAAFILEPLQGEGGVVVPPAGYLSEVREICDDYGVLLILDEVQTGMGRTGKWFACQEEEVVPDILCLAKALGGGIMPIGAILSRPSVWQPMLENPWIHTSTFGGSPLACAAAIAAIEVMMEENLAEQAREKGLRIMQRLQKLAERYPRVIADVRGRGLLIGIEFVKEGVGGVVIGRMVENQIIVGYTLNNPRVVRLEPPLNVADEDIDRVLDVLEAAVAEANEIIEEL